METIHTLLFVLQSLVSVALIGIILVQHGKGADAGAAFGSGSSSTVFGSRGSGNFMTKTTSFLAVIFLTNSLLLGYLATNSIKTTPASLLDKVATEQQTTEQQDMPAETESVTTGNGDLPNLPAE